MSTLNRNAVTPYARRLLAFPSQFNRREQHLVITSAIIGAVVWLVVYTLKLAVHFSADYFFAWAEAAPTPLVIAIPIVLGSLITVAIARWHASSVYYRDKDGHVHELNDVEGDGLERTIALYYTSEPALDRSLIGVQGVRARWELPTFSLAIRKYGATLATLGTAASGGLEASVSLIGESLAVGLLKPRMELLPRKVWVLRLWRWWRTLDPDELQTAQLSGVAAAVATLVGAPLAGAFFAVEVIYRRRPIIEKFIYALVAALTANLLGRIFAPNSVRFISVSTLTSPPLDARYYFFLVMLAVFVAIVDVYLRKVRSGMSTLFHAPMFTRPWHRHVLGAFMTAAIGLAAAQLAGEPLDLVLGTGDHVVNAALAGQLTVWVAAVALIGKLFATMSTISSGGSAGMLVPSMYLGAMAGAIVAGISGYPAPMLVVPAIAAGLVSLVNVPVTALLFTAELFGASYLLPAIVVLLVTLLLSHPTSVYRTQRDLDNSREVLPGYGIRRFTVPNVWDGKSLRQLNLRSQFDINVIGLVDNAEQGLHITPSVPAMRPLHAGERLVVMGKNEALGALLAYVYSLENSESAEKNAGAAPGQAAAD